MSVHFWSRSISLAFIKCGCSGTLALAIGFAVRALLASEFATLTHYMQPAGGSSGEEASTSWPKQPWERDLDLPDKTPAPQSLRTHAREELYQLFNIGKKKTVGEAFFNRCIEGLVLENPTISVDFFRELLLRVEQLKEEHYNKGNHIPFEWKKEKGKIESIMWEYK